MNLAVKIAFFDVDGTENPCVQKDDMTAGGSDYSQAVSWYRHYSTNLGWKDLGQVLGRSKQEEARKLGRSL